MSDQNRPARDSRAGRESGRPENSRRESSRPENSLRHENRVLDFLFDLRMIIAILFAVYGIVCVIWGAGFTPSSQLAKADGININLWAGVGMIVVAALFLWWTLAKPIEESDEDAARRRLEESEAEAQRNL